MKFTIKYLITLACVAIVSSCTSEDIVDSQSADEDVTVNLLLTTESEDGTMTRAMSDGKKVDKLYYAIFTEAGDTVIPKATVNNAEGLTSETGFPMTLTLAKGRSYKAVFWAQNSQSEAYTVSDGMVVDVDYSKACNDDNSDAFYGVSSLFATSGESVKVTLRRPFAQLNVAAYPFDWEYINDHLNFEVTKSCVRVRNVAHSVNLLTGELSNWGSAQFKSNALPSENLEADIDEDGTPELYTYVSMAYVLAGAEPTTHSAEVFYLNDEGKAVICEKSGLSEVTLQRNTRTDFLGQVLTADGEINIREYDDDGNQPDGDVYYNVSEPTTIENTIYNMSDHGTALQFASVDGQLVTYNNLLFTGEIWTIELGEYRTSSYVKYNNLLNNVEYRNLSVSSCIECHEWYFSPACIAYGKSTFNNCVMKGATTTQTTRTDKHGVVHEVIPVDIGVRNESDAWFYGGEFGTMFAWTHAVVEIYDAKIDKLYCGTCDSTPHSWMTIGSGTTIDKVICCEPRCPYGGKEYSTTMTIKKGAKVGSLQLVSTDVEFLIIEEGAEVGPITCEGVEYTYKELRNAMGLDLP